MSSDVIRNWDKILHKNVRSKDMDGVGNVIAINDDNDSISITTQGSQHIYKIPKSHIEGYNGAEVFLDLTAADMSKYDIDSESQGNTEDTITTTTSTTTATKSATETLSRPTLPRTQVQTSISITEKRTESPTTDIPSSRPPLIIDNKSSSPSNEALKTKRREAEDKARREAEDKARREAEALEHATTTKESIEPLPQQQTIRQENLIRSKENTNNYLRNDLDPFAANMTSWQYSTISWIDMYKEFAINAAKLSEYWFNLFWSPWTKDKNISRK